MSSTDIYLTPEDIKEDLYVEFIQEMVGNNSPVTHEDLVFNYDNIFDDHGLHIDIEYDYYPGSPGCLYLPNGDPGDPPEPPSVDILNISLMADKSTLIDIDIEKYLDFPEEGMISKIMDIDTNH